MNHTLRMLLGCMLPLILLFVLPLFGVGSGVTLFIFIVLMFMCHLMMLGGHRHQHGSHTPSKETHDERPTIHRHHQH